MNKITDKINKYTQQYDVDIWQSLCDSCSERHLPNWQVGRFCFEDWGPGLMVQLANLKEVKYD